MDLKTIIELISSSNINTEAVYELVNEASNLDLKDEENLRKIIRRGCDLANKNISKNEEDKIINLLAEKGISKELFTFLK